MYLRSHQELEAVLEATPSSAVILNATQKQTDGKALPMGQVLSGLLNGPTRSFTALVGYFGHRVDQEVLERYEGVTQSADLGQLRGEDPAGLIVHEAIEENVHGSRDFDATSFRLLVGAMSSRSAQDAARACEIGSGLTLRMDEPGSCVGYGLSRPHSDVLAFSRCFVDSP